MISPQIGQAAFRIAFMMITVSVVLLFVVTPGSAEYVITIVTLILGLIFAGIIFVLVRLMGN